MRIISKRAVLSLGPSVLVVANIFLFGPLIIYQGNIDEFVVSFSSVLAFFLLPAFILVSLLISIGVVLSHKMHQRYISILFVFGILIWIQGNILVWDYGLIGKGDIDWAKYAWHGWIDGALWLFFLVAAFIFYEKIYRISALASIILLSLQLLFSSFISFQKPEIWKDKKASLSPMSSNSEIFQFSAKQNIIHIILDEFLSTVFDDIINEHP